MAGRVYTVKSEFDYRKCGIVGAEDITQLSECLPGI